MAMRCTTLRTPRSCAQRHFALRSATGPLRSTACTSHRAGAHAAAAPMGGAGGHERGRHTPRSCRRAAVADGGGAGRLGSGRQVLDRRLAHFASPREGPAPLPGVLPRRWRPSRPPHLMSPPHRGDSGRVRTVAPGVDRRSARAAPLGPSARQCSDRLRRPGVTPLVLDARAGRLQEGHRASGVSSALSTDKPLSAAGGGQARLPQVRGPMSVFFECSRILGRCLAVHTDM